MSSPKNDNSTKETGTGGSVGFGLVVRAIFRHPFVLFLFLLLAGAAGTATWFYLPLPKLTVYSIFNIKAQPEAVFRAEGDGKIEFNTFRTTQAAIIKSHPVLNSVVDDAEIAELSIFGKESDKVRWLESQLKVDFKLGSEFMQLSIEGNNSSDLKTVIDAITVCYMRDVVNKDKSKHAMSGWTCFPNSTAMRKRGWRTSEKR